MAHKQFVADFSLALINRTGAYYVCRDVVEQLARFFVAVRYWRLHLRSEPRGLTRKLLGRAMLFELNNMAFTEALPRSRAPGAPEAATLFFDPLYVLRTRLRREDIVLCHDVGPIASPELFDAGTSALYRSAYECIAAARPGMVFVSEASRSAFAAALAAPCRFERVIPLYVRRGIGEGACRAPEGVRAPFLLTVGAPETRKNHRRVIDAFAASGLRERGYTYVLCGPRGNSAQAVESLARSVAGVHALGYLSDAELCWLYRHAAGFVLPSLLEGFGLPALEAAQQELISIVSAGGAQQEAVGEGAILVDPTSVADIARGMHRLVDMSADERRERLVLAKRQAAALTRERFLQSWADLLALQ